MDSKPAIATFVDQTVQNHTRLAPHSKKLMAAHCKAFCEFAAIDSSSALARVDVKVVRAWVASMAADSLSQLTIRQRLSSLRTFLREFVEKGLLPLNPVEEIRVTILKTTRAPRIKDELTQEQEERLLELMEDNQKGRRDRAIVALIMDTGIRRGELLNLRNVDVAFKDGVPDIVTIRGKSHPHRYQVGTISKAFIMEYIKADKHASDPNAPLFTPIVNRTDGELNRALSATSLHHNIMSKYAEMLGLPRTANLFQMLRRRAQGRNPSS